MVKRILYVDSNIPDNPRNEVQEKIVKALADDGFIIGTYGYLNGNIVTIVANAIRHNKRYDVLITNLPDDRSLIPEDAQYIADYSFYSVIFGRSLGIINLIKGISPDLHIIAYTSVDDNPSLREVFRNHGIDDIIFRSQTMDLEQDLSDIRQRLSRL